MGERSSGPDLDVWLAPFLAAMGRKTRRTWAPLYLRGLLGPGDRKSLQPMAARLGLPGHDQLHHFIASPAWDDTCEPRASTSVWCWPMPAMAVALCSGMASTRGLTWARGIRPEPEGVRSRRAAGGAGRAREPVPDQAPREAEAVLAALLWRRVTWRQGTNRELYDVLDTSMGARAEPLFITISAQSNDPQHIL